MRAAVPKEIIDGIRFSDRLDQIGSREELFYDRRLLIAALDEALDQRDDALRLLRDHRATTLEIYGILCDTITAQTQERAEWLQAASK